MANLHKTNHTVKHAPLTMTTNLQTAVLVKCRTFVGRAERAACPLSVLQSLHHVVHAASLSFAAACPLSVLHHVAHAPSLWPNLSLFFSLSLTSRRSCSFSLA